MQGLPKSWLVREPNPWKEKRRKRREELKKIEEKRAREYWEKRKRKKELERRLRKENVIIVYAKNLVEIVHRENMTFDEAVQLFEAVTKKRYTRTSVRYYLRKYGIKGKKGRRCKIKNVPSHVLERIRQLKSKGHGLRYISGRIAKDYGIFISCTSLWRIFKYDIDKLIEEAKKREEGATKVIELIKEFHRESDEKFRETVRLEGNVFYGWKEYDEWLIDKERELARQLTKRFTVRQLLIANRYYESDIIWYALIYAAGSEVRIPEIDGVDLDLILFTRRVVMIR